MEKMINRKDERGCWGCEEKGERQLRSRRLQLNHEQHKRVMLKIGRRAQMKQSKQCKWERMCPVRSRKWSAWELSWDRKKGFRLHTDRDLVFHMPFFWRERTSKYKPLFRVGKWKLGGSGWKSCIKKISVLTPERPLFPRARGFARE